MKTKTCKRYFMPLRGFTLIEILVAITIITTIVSMVYGSYFATAESADAYKAKMALSSQTRNVLNQMARQIRCSYIGKPKEDTDSNGKNKIVKNPVVYFNYEDVSGTGVLHFVTTHRLFCEDGYADGLFDVVYKFDESTGTLYLSQRIFFGSDENYSKDRSWRPILTDVESVEMEFFDGQQWSRKWDFAQKRILPLAVKIDITCRDENFRQCHYGTMAYIDCSKNNDYKFLSEKSVSGK